MKPYGSKPFTSYDIDPWMKAGRAGVKRDAAAEIASATTPDIQVGSKVRHRTGEWTCGCECDPELVHKVEEIDDEIMAFIGTPCGWQWYPVCDLVLA